MARVVDPERKAQRDSAIDSLAMARNEVSLMHDKCAEILSRTDREVGGHPMGDAMVAQMSQSVDALTRAWSRLKAASQATIAIDVTVEVPDPPRR